MILIRVLSSVRFAIVIFVLTAVASGAATIFRWPGFFSSFYFLVPVGLFALSLLTCTINSLVRRPRRRITGYAHDIIHIGILILMMGGLLTHLAGREEVVTLSIGETITVRNEWDVTLIDSRRTGMNWESTLRIQRKETEETREEVVSVNQPVSVGPVRLLQQTWQNPRVLVLEDDEGNRYTMTPGEGFAAGETVIILEESPESDIGLRFVRFEDSRRSGTITVEPGMSIAELTVVTSQERILSGIQVVHDPGAAVALVGALLLMLGLGLYLLKKAREER